MIDAYSETWQAVRDKAIEVIEQSRSRLEQRDQTEAETQFLRGKIAALRQMLEMSQPKPIIATDQIPDALRPRDRSGI